MKVVFGASHYPPKYAAGMELITQRSARWLVEHGHSVEVVCVERIDADEHVTVETHEQDGVIVHRLGLKLAGGNQHLGLRYRDEAVGNWFADYLTRSKPDLFHSQSCYLLTASTIEAAVRVGVPVVATLHDYWFHCPRINLLRSNGELCVESATPNDCAWCLMAERRRYRYPDAVLKTIGKHRWQGHSEAGPLGWPLDSNILTTVKDRQVYLDNVLRLADQIVVSGAFGHQLLRARGIPEAKIKLLLSGIEFGQGQRPLAQRSNRGLRIGYLGQLSPHKGVHLLIQAFQRLVPTMGEPELNIYGDTTRDAKYVAGLRRLAAGSDRIHFRGSYDNRRVPEILANVDVLCVPSVWFEVYPLVILEAFSARVPVVASRLPNMQYRIHEGTDGLLFGAGDVGDLARQLQRLVDDPSFVERLSQGVGPVRSVDEEMRETAELYCSLVDGTVRSTGRSSELSLSSVGHDLG